MKIESKDILPLIGTPECIPIFEEMKPFLSKEVLEMCGTVIEELGDPESTELHCCFIKKTCSNEVTVVDLEWLAMFVNNHKALGHIEGGVLCPPFKMKLHYIDKWILFFYPFTRIPNSKIKTL